MSRWAQLLPFKPGSCPWSGRRLRGALLRRLSVFAGGWTVEAAEAVCSGEGLAAADVLDELTLLVEKSMVLLDEQARQPRYRMLETIRQYALEKLVEAGETALAGYRRLAYILNFAEAAEPHFLHPDQLERYARADTELDNVRAALEWSLAQSQVEPGMRLANALHRYWVARRSARRRCVPHRSLQGQSGPSRNACRKLRSSASLP